MFRLTLCLILLFPALTQAEYRAFMLHLLNEKTQVVKQILTTLDPDQYRTQFPLNANEKLTYVQTWRCKGRTDFFQPICEKPDRNPALAPSQSPESPSKN
jgi:hypothetical protein